MESDLSRQSEAKAENRKLIKFSNYSLCVTLPKWVIKELNWNKGDVVRLIVDEKKAEILIKKRSASEKPKTEKAIPGKTVSSKPAKKSRW